MRKSRPFRLEELLSRITPAAGSLDVSFGTNGTVLQDSSDFSDSMSESLVVQGDGKIISVGKVTASGIVYPTFFRYNADGSPDTSFSDDGIAILDIPGGTCHLYSVAIQTDGKIVATGTAELPGEYQAILIRLNADGTPDSSFGVDGVVMHSSGLIENGFAVALQADGKIVLGGEIENTIGGGRAMMAARYDTDGTLDPTFATDGIAMVDFGDGSETVKSVLVQSDGRIVLAGNSSLGFALARLNTDGTLDTSFDGDGLAESDLADLSVESINDAVLQPDGKVLAAGAAMISGDPIFGHPVLLRYNTDGSLDTTFDSDGWLVQDLPTNGGTYDGIAVQPDGKFVVGGTYVISGLGPILIAARYNADGTLDTSFNPPDTSVIPGIVMTQISGGYFATAVQSDGNIVASGTASGPIRAVIARYKGSANYPSAARDAYSTDQDHVLTVDAPGILGNDDFPAGFTTTVNVIQQPSHGTLVLQQDGSFAYTPDTGYYGVDSFQYQLDNGIVGNVANVILTVNQAGAVPSSADDSYSVDQDLTLTVDAPGVLANDVFLSGLTTTVNVIQQPTHGTLQLQQDGSFAYTPDARFHGDDSFQYQLDNGVPGNIATVNITVNNTGADPVSTDDAYSVDEDQVLTVDPAGILANDQFPSNLTVTINIIDQPTHGSLELQQDGSFVYTPDTNYHGTDGFTYQLDNGVAGNIAMVSLTINSVNDVPVTFRDEYVIPGSGNLDVPANLGVLNNDTDVEGDSLRAVLVTPPADGTLTLNDDGSFTYTPPVAFVGDTSFQYLATDGTDDGDVVTVTLTRNPMTQVSGTKLIINGGDGADSVRLIPSGTTGIYVELISRTGVIRQTLRPAARNQKFTQIEVNLAGGNDYFDAASVAIPIRVIGGAGRDYIRTGSGADTIFGESIAGVGDGKDVIISGAGNDRILAGDGDTLIDSGAGNDTVTAGNGDNRIDTGIGNDSVTAGNGDNRIDAGVGNDTISIGDGFNAVYAGAGNDSVTGGTGQSFVDGGAGNDYVSFIGGQNTILGGAGSDVLLGGSGVDMIEGESGNDLIAGGLGADLLSGGDGNDILIDGTVTLKNPTTDTFAKILATFNPAKAASLVKIKDQLIYTKDTASVDTVYGNAGVDWFWMEFSNDISDIGGNEPLRG